MLVHVYLAILTLLYPHVNMITLRVIGLINSSSTESFSTLFYSLEKKRSTLYSPYDSLTRTRSVVYHMACKAVVEFLTGVGNPQVEKMMSLDWRDWRPQIQPATIPSLLPSL